MTIRVYIVPQETVTANGQTKHGPAYFAWATVKTIGVVCSHTSTYYDAMGVVIVTADVTNAQHNAIRANSDVMVLPANLDTALGTNLATVQAALEARNLPSEWITSGMTYRTVLRGIVALCLLSQRHHGLFRLPILESGFTLNSTVGDLPLAARQRLNSVAQSFNFDTSGITLSTTIRAALRVLFQQWTRPIHLGLGVTL